MKNNFKKIEKLIKKIRRYPGENFTNQLSNDLYNMHPYHQKNNNSQWSFNKLIDITMKRKIAISLAATLIVLGGSILISKTDNPDHKIADVFLSKAYAGYEKTIKENFSHRIQLESGENFEEYLAIFDKDEKLSFDLREYGRSAYVFNMISSPNIDLFYENERPILKIKTGDEVKYFRYLLEKGVDENSVGKIAWEEIYPETRYDHQDQILTLIKDLQGDNKTILIENSDSKIALSRPTSIDLGTGDTVYEEYYFDKQKKELIKKDEVTTRDGKKYVLRTESFTINEKNEETFSFFENDDLISLSAEQCYYAGGANGFQYFATFNYDKKNKKLISINDIFTNTKNGLERLSAYSREKLTEKVQYKDMINDGTKPIVANFSQFNYVQDDNNKIAGINLHFSKYQVAPGYEGSIDLFVPIKIIQDLMK